MSKIGKKIIAIPDGASISIEGNVITVKGKKGEIKTPILPGVRANFDEKELSFELTRNSKQARSNWGTTRALAANAIDGVNNGFSKVLILEGVGFRVSKDGEGLILNLGFSHQVKYGAVPGISFEVEKNLILTISGIDKALVGKTAAEIRTMKKAEPYKGKGFRYKDEVVRRKDGKKSGSA